MKNIAVLSSCRNGSTWILYLECGHRAERSIRKGRPAPTSVKICMECANTPQTASDKTAGDEEVKTIPHQFKNPATPRPQSVLSPSTQPKVHPMNVEILQHGRVLHQHYHNGQTYVEAPPYGDYQIRLSNPCGQRRLVVLSVDGVNVIDGETASYKGSGYVLGPYQTTTIKGWRRSDAEVASFQFKASAHGEDSYAAQTGRSTKNTGIIGVAVFDEKPCPRFLRSTILCSNSRGCISNDPTLDISCSADDGLCPEGSDQILGVMPCTAASTEYEKTTTTTTTTVKPVGMRGTTRERRITKNSQVRETAPSLGTGYGNCETMYTTETIFKRASETPSLVMTLRYGVRAKLLEWGVPLSDGGSPSAFPGSEGVSVAPPPGWRG